MCPINVVWKYTHSEELSNRFKATAAHAKVWHMLNKNYYKHICKKENFFFLKRVENNTCINVLKPVIIHGGAFRLSDWFRRGL